MSSSEDFLQELRALKIGNQDAVLELLPFGKGRAFSVWIRPEAWRQVAVLLRSRSEFVCLENLAAHRVNDELLISLFVRGRPTSAEVYSELIALRCSVKSDGIEAFFSKQTLSQVWPVAEQMEQEALTRFGTVGAQ